MLIRIDRTRKLYVLKCGAGVSCLGFEFAEKRRKSVLQWIGIDPEHMRTGTKRHYSAYVEAMRLGMDHHNKTGQRCEAELIPALRGLEGKRVEVTTPDGSRNRFYIGRSTGWLPCHLEVKTRRSTGGAAAYIPDGSTVTVVGKR